MRRVLSLHLPRWAADRWRRAQDEAPSAPVVIVGRRRARRLVLGVDAAAQALGVTPGLALAQAQARTPGLHVVEEDPSADEAALERLAMWALGRYAPLVAVDGADGLLIETTGAAHRFGGETGMLDDFLQRLAAQGIAAQAAVAGSPGAAHALARHGGARAIVAEADERVRVEALATAALRIEPELVAALGKLGFETIGDLERAPRSSLALRFGPALTHRLDQAFGRVFESFEPLVPPERVRVRHAWIEPVSAPETMANRMSRVVAALCAVLEARGLGARTLDLVCECVDGRRPWLRIGTARPNRDPRRLTRLFADRLGTIDPGFGVEAMNLTAVLAEPLQPRAGPSALAGETATADVADLVDVLANRLGAGKVWRVAPVESDLPERSVRRIGATAPPTGRSWPTRWPRPSRLLSPPERVEAMAVLPDQPPVAFTWRGRRRRVRRADGPERVYGEWWRDDAESEAVRDYFAVEDEAGERYWLYRQGDGERLATGDLSWFLHGVFA